MIQLELDVTPQIEGVSFGAEWPEWEHRNVEWCRLSDILKPPPFPGDIWCCDSYAHRDSDYVRRYGLAWCCVVVAAVLLLRKS